MSRVQRVTSFLGTWELLALLSALLALSVWANYVQWRRSVTAELRVENAELTRAVGVFTRIAERRDEQDRLLLGRMELYGQAAEAFAARYQRLAFAQPLAKNCYPGAERVEAVNQGLGPVTGASK